jgi:hypothetical protein
MRAFVEMVKARQAENQPAGEREKRFFSCQELAEKVSKKAEVLQGKLAEHCQQIIN